MYNKREEGGCQDVAILIIFIILKIYLSKILKKYPPSGQTSNSDSLEKNKNTDHIYYAAWEPQDGSL